MKISAQMNPWTKKSFKSPLYFRSHRIRSPYPDTDGLWTQTIYSSWRTYAVSDCSWFLIDYRRSQVCFRFQTVAPFLKWGNSKRLVSRNENRGQISHFLTPPPLNLGEGWVNAVIFSCLTRTQLLTRLLRGLELEVRFKITRDSGTNVMSCRLSLGGLVKARFSKTDLTENNQEVTPPCSVCVSNRVRQSPCKLSIATN